MRLPAITAPDAHAARAARERIDSLTKPPGSLGRIEELAVRLCAIAGGIPKHRYEGRAILIGAGDHGVAREGVSAYPPEVTAQMVGGFCAEIAAINAFARAVRAQVFVADFGVDAELPPHHLLFDLKVGRGTASLASGNAMTSAEAISAIEAGFEAFARVAGRVSPLHLLALGEMGIGNTTPAAALIAVFAKTDPGLIVGRGTGIDDAGYARKLRIVETAVERSGSSDPLATAAALGGFEILGLAGAMLAAASARVPVVVDGFIVAAAALVARALDPNVCGYLIPSHRSQEPGHIVALRALGLEPLFDLDLRLGEASGAALAMPLVEAAIRMLTEMKTFAEAGVSTADDASTTA